MAIMKYRTIMLNDSLFISLPQFVAILYKSVSIRENNLRSCIVTSTKDTHQIAKCQMYVAESLIFSLILLSLLERTLFY